MADCRDFQRCWEVQKLNDQGQIDDLTVYLRPYPAVTVLRNSAKSLDEKGGGIGADYWELNAHV